MRNWWSLQMNTDFNYLSDSAFYLDLRNNCTHCFGYIYCRRYKELLIKLFRMTRVKLPAKFCSHRPRVECNECFGFYKLYYLKDPIKTWVSTVMLFERYSRHVHWSSKLFSDLQKNWTRLKWTSGSVTLWPTSQSFILAMTWPSLIMIYRRSVE